MMNDDMELVREYAARQSEQAFATLVARHINLVHTAALRQVRDPQLAAEVTQTVFIILARKAATLSPQTILSGWLYRTGQFVARAALKQEFRRQRREQEYLQMTTPHHEIHSAWDRWSPFLDEAMARLRDKDRDAIILRYFENRSLKEVGSALGVEERAAQKRVARGLEKLRVSLAKRGIRLTTAVIVSAVSAHSVQAAPVAMATSVTTVAFAQGAAASGSTLALIKGALKLMAWTKAKVAVVTAAGIILAASVSVVVVEQTGRVQGKTESEWIKSIVYNGDDNQRHLWQSLGPRGVRILIHGLNPAKYDRQTRMGAGDMLGQLEDYDGEKGYHADKSAIPDLIRLLKIEPDDSVRGIELACFEMPIQSMPENEKTELFPELLRAFQSEDISVRNNALVALQYYPGKTDTVIPLLVQSLRDSAPQVRLMAVKALNKVDPQTAAQSDVVKVLLGCLTGLPGDAGGLPGSHGNPGTANDAVIALGEWHREPGLVVPALIQSLGNADVYIRQNAAAALGRFGGEARAAVPALLTARNDADVRVRNQAVAALKRINAGALPK